MMMYEYECRIQGVFEAMVEQENRGIPRPCSDCGAESPNVVSAPNIDLEGISGDFPSAYNTWGNKHSGVKQKSHWLNED